MRMNIMFLSNCKIGMLEENNTGIKWIEVFSVRQADIHTKLHSKFPTLSQKNLLLMSEKIEILILKGVKDHFFQDNVQ